MPEIRVTVSPSWRDGVALWAVPAAPSWRDGVALWSLGGAYTPGEPPVGGAATAPAIPAAPYSIPAATGYHAEHAVSLTDLRSGDALEVRSLTVSTDEDSIVWTLRATTDAAAMAALMSGEQPAELELSIDGVRWRFVVDSVSRSRAFPKTECSVVAYSLAKAAGAPLAATQNWIISEDTTAAQIAAMAVLYTGVRVDWQCDDWLIPAGIFSFSGTPLEVVRRVAEAIGAVVQSDPYEPVLYVTQRYREMPNAWPYIVPDVDLALDAVAVEQTERNDQPAYDGVYLSGQQSGELGFVRLAGTAGSYLHPLVTDQLLTDQIAIRQRGESLLGAGGEQANVTLTLPFVVGEGRPGAMRVGQLQRVLDPAGAWVGRARSVAISYARPKVRQTVVLERHTAPIPGTVVTPSTSRPLALTELSAGLSCVQGREALYSIDTSLTGGVRPFRYSLRKGALPPGMVLGSASGLVTGTPTVVGSFSARFRVEDATFGQVDTGWVAFTVGPALAWSGSLANWSLTVGTAMSQLNLSAGVSGGISPYSYSVAAGALPAGLALNAETGVVSGTPTAIGSGSVRFQVADSAGASVLTNAVTWAVAAPAATGDPLWPYVILRLPLDTGIADVSGAGLTMSIGQVMSEGSPSYTAGVKAAAALYGAGGWEASGDPDAWAYSYLYAWLPSGLQNWGSQNWCLECQLKVGSTSSTSYQRRLTSGTSGNGVALVTKGTQVGVWVRVGDTFANPFSAVTVGSVSDDVGLSATGVLTTGRHHIAASRSGTTVRVFVDGVIVFQATISASLSLADQVRLTVAGYPEDLGSANSGATDYIDDVRVTLGAARYTAAFTPPAAALPVN